MTLAVGSRLGPYEILAPIGAGGMGEDEVNVAFSGLYPAVRTSRPDPIEALRYE